MKRIFIYPALAIVLAGVAVGAWWHARDLSGPRTAVVYNANMAHRGVSAVDADAWPRPDTLNLREQPSKSPWQESEKKRFAALLKRKPCDTLVVPTQSQASGFDRATRSLMTAQLAALIASEPDRCVVDPYLAARALGEGMRRYDVSEVHALAKDLGAKTIVWTYAGHDNHMNMALFVRTEQIERSRYGYRELKSKSWPQVPFSDESPPFVAWLPTLQVIANEFGFKGAVASPPSAEGTGIDMPATLEQIAATPSSGSLDAARRYELLAMLAPAVDSRPAERLFEKAWLSAARAADTRESRRVRARALFHLGYRPAALALLRDDDGAESGLLQALLNGNLPEAQKLAAEIKSERESLLAAIDVRDLALAYARKGDPQPAAATLKTYGSRSDPLALLLAARLGDGDAWDVTDNRSSKAMLDTLYPIEGQSYDEYIRGRLTVGETPTESTLDVLPIRHVNRLLDQAPERFCCDGDRTSPGPLDLLDLIEARAVANIERKITRMVRLQGQGESALRQLDELDSELSGHPHFAALRATALVELLMNRKDERAPERTRRLFEEASRAAFFEQGNSVTAMNALISMGVPSGGSMPYLTAYDNDFPPKPYWYRDLTGYAAEKAGAEAALRYSSSNPKPLEDLFRITKEADRPQLRQALDTRFHGARSLAEVRASFGRKSEDGIDSEGLRKQLAEDPGDWNTRYRLVMTLIEQADYDGAVNVAKDYPGFKAEAGENAVALSNYAQRVASDLFWRGAIEQSKVMYRLAAGGETGSEAEMMANQRLKLLDGHYVESAQIAAQRVARYGNPYAIRDYLGMLFAFGYSKDAWAAFAQSARQKDTEELWISALIGYRREGATTEKFEKWLSGDLMRAPTEYGDIPSLKLGMAWFLMDRPRDAALPAFLETIAGKENTFLRTHGGGVMRSHANGGRFPLEQSAFRRSERTAVQSEQTIPSEYILFAEAYDAFSSGDHAVAVQKFDRLATYYSIEGARVGPDIAVALPYFAFSSAKVGDTLGLKPFLESLPPERQRANVHLALAYFAGLAGQHDEATKQLHLAMGKSEASLGVTSIVTYQYAEVCARLFDETHEVRYRDMALDWARKYQRMDPAMAWAYALEARYGDPHDKGHLRAVALAQYLDRDSYWLSAVPKAEQLRAHEWLARNNPFLVKSGGRSDI